MAAAFRAGGGVNRNLSRAVVTGTFDLQRRASSRRFRRSGADQPWRNGLQGIIVHNKARLIPFFE
jgi:hypothetical protein